MIKYFFYKQTNSIMTNKLTRLYNDNKKVYNVSYKTSRNFKKKAEVAIIYDNMTKQKKFLKTIGIDKIYQSLYTWVCLILILYIHPLIMVLINVLLL